MKKHYYARVVQISPRNKRKVVCLYDVVSHSCWIKIEYFKNIVKISCDLLGQIVVKLEELGVALHVMKEQLNSFAKRTVFPHKPPRRYVEAMIRVHENDMMEFYLSQHN